MHFVCVDSHVAVNYIKYKAVHNNVLMINLCEGNNGNYKFLVTMLNEMPKLLVSIRCYS